MEENAGPRALVQSTGFISPRTSNQALSLSLLMQLTTDWKPLKHVSADHQLGCRKTKRYKSYQVNGCSVEAHFLGSFSRLAANHMDDSWEWTLVSLGPRCTESSFHLPHPGGLLSGLLSLGWLSTHFPGDQCKHYSIDLSFKKHSLLCI